MELTDHKSKNKRCFTLCPDHIHPRADVPSLPWELAFILLEERNLPTPSCTQHYLLNSYKSGPARWFQYPSFFTGSPKVLSHFRSAPWPNAGYITITPMFKWKVCEIQEKGCYLDSWKGCPLAAKSTALETGRPEFESHPYHHRCDLLHLFKPQLLHM